MSGEKQEAEKTWMRLGEPAHASKCVTLLWCFSLSRRFFGFFLLVREMHTPEELSARFQTSFTSMNARKALVTFGVN